MGGGGEFALRVSVFVAKTCQLYRSTRLFGWLVGTNGWVVNVNDWLIDRTLGSMDWLVDGSID